MTNEELIESFEVWYQEEYRWEMKRAAPGRGGYSLKKYDGEYVSDHARNDFKVWCAAIKRFVK